MTSDQASGASGDEQSTCRLNPVLSLAEARDLHDQLKTALGAKDITIDAGQVERMSTPCVQVLLAAGCAADAAGHRFRIANASESFLAALADFGLQSKFSKWVA